MHIFVPFLRPSLVINQVHDALRNIGRVPDPSAVLLPIVGCEETFHYRNNMEVGLSG